VKDAEDICRHLGIDQVVYEIPHTFDNLAVWLPGKKERAAFMVLPEALRNQYCVLTVLGLAASELRCDKIATGHYARVVHDLDTGRYALKRALDEASDQTYILSLLSQEQLKHLMLPLGGYTKLEVCNCAEGLHIPLARVGMQSDSSFLSKGKGCQGRAESTQGNHARNTISSFEVVALNWMSAQPDELCMVKVRYRLKPVLARVTILDAQRASVEFPSPQLGVERGFCCAFYQGSLLLGGGIIDKLVFSE
jgi:tRNA U34 2-thiouridine synthase MnmA/TrmU